MELLIQEGTAIDVNYFDQIVSNLYNVGSDQTHPDQSEANSILMKFQERKDAWLVVQEVITNSHNTTSKFIALQTFTKGAQTNWEMIDENQRNFLKKFYFDLFFQWCTENTEAILMTEVSRALIEILKNEWPTYWPTFMHDFIQNCNRNEYTILYGLKLLAILSEETHEYLDDMLTTDRMSEFSRALEADYSLVFTFLESVFLQTSDNVIVKQGLETLSHFLKWVDIPAITSTPLCQYLVNNLFPIPEMRLPVLKCFDAIATHNYATGDKNMIQIFELLIFNIQRNLNSPITVAYGEDPLDLQLILTLGHFLILDNSSILQGILTESAKMALFWLAELTSACKIETFKIAVEYWLSLSKIFCLEKNIVQPPEELIFRLQEIFIQRMPRPPEFSPLVTDEEINIESNDNDFVEKMRKTIVCLSNVAKNNIVNLLISHLQNSQNQEEVLIICWSIGAISGSLPKSEEQQFLVEVINILFKFMNQEMSIQMQSLFYGCYLFILSLYPRFLAFNWFYLKQYLDKSIQFFMTPYPPLQNMAVNRLKAIAFSIPTPLLVKHTDQQQSFAYELLENAERLANVLPMNCVPTLYEAIAMIIKQHKNEEEKARMVSKLLVLPVRSWEESIERLNSNTSCDDEITIKVLFPIDIFGKIILISNFAFYPQIEAVITRTMDLYKFYSSELPKHSAHPNLIQIKTQLLLLYEAFLHQHPDSEIVPSLVEMLTTDFTESPPQLRFSLILDCFTAMVKTLGERSQPLVYEIVMKVIVPTFDMIKESYNAYPEIRLSLFKLLNLLMTKVFSSVQSFKLDIFSSMLDCLLYGVAHPKNDISTLALNCISGLLSDVDSNPEDEFRRVFYDTFYMKILFQLFSVLTDRAHKFIFSELAKTMSHLFQIVEKKRVLLNGDPNTDNIIANTLAENLSKEFTQFQPSFILEFTRALIVESSNFGQFQELLRNFLIGTKKVQPSDRDLYLAEINDREMAISGLNGPAIPDDLPEDAICEF